MWGGHRGVKRARVSVSWYGVLAVIGMLLLAGCASGSRSPIALREASVANADGTSTPDGTGFLATDNLHYAAFLQWTVTHGAISGTMQTDWITGIPPFQRVTLDRYQVTGNITGGQVGLSLGGPEVSGTFSDGVLMLNIPNFEGLPMAETFAPAYPVAFDRTVQHLHWRVDNGNQAAEESNLSARPG